MKTDTLDALSDDELRDLIGRAQGTLQQRHEDRKAKALGDARALLASVGLSLKDLGGKRKAKPAKAPVYHTGHHYQHPTDKDLVWNGKGKKPGWLVALEGEGKTAIEIGS